MSCRVTSSSAELALTIATKDKYAAHDPPQYAPSPSLTSHSQGMCTGDFRFPHHTFVC